MLSFAKSRLAGKKLFFLAVFILFAVNPVLSQDTIHVPADYTTIQAGIDASNNGDIVLVAEDTYYENINYNGKAITIASHFLIDGDTSHISNTIIDGSQPIYSDSASVVLFKSGEDSNSVLNGFTLKGGSGTVTNFGWYVYVLIGGGIYCLDTSPTILNTIIKRNNNGGGYIEGGNAQPHLFKVSICNNGIGLFLRGCTPRLDNVDIAYNVPPDIGNFYGGGIECWGANPQLSNVNIHHNIAEYGGGIYLKNWNGYNSNPFFDPVDRCNIYLNLARIGGNDIAAETPTNYQIVVDTFTVLQPSEIHAYPLNQFSFDIQNEKIDLI